MEHYPKFLKGIALSALASVVLYGSALAVPTPTYPRFDPGSDATVSVPSATVASAPGARILSRTGNLSLGRGTFRSGGASISPSVASIGSSKSSRFKNRYLLSGMVLAALTPLALHHSGEPGDKSVAVETRTPSNSTIANLGDGISTGNGHGRGGNGNGGNGGNDHSGDGNGDGGDCNNNDNSGDNDSGDNGDQVCDSGDSGDQDTGDHGSGDCDNGGGETGGGGNNGGGDHGGGGTSLPEPGTVPLVGAGLMMALAFRSRRVQ